MRDAMNGLGRTKHGAPPHVKDRIGIPLLQSGLTCSKKLSAMLPKTDLAKNRYKNSITLFLTDDDWLRKAATDEKRNIRSHDGQLVITTDVTPCHTDSCTLPTADDGSGACSPSNESRRCYIEAVMDHLLLASADTIVFATGGFGITAASVGFIPSSNRIFGPGCNRCQPHGWCVDQTWFDPSRRSH